VNYADEPYVRLFVNDTVTWELLPWEARTVLLHMLKGKFDRSGVFEHGSHTPSRAVAARAKIPEDLAATGLAQLLKEGIWEAADGCLVWPAYVEAQNTARTPAARKRQEREQRQAFKLQGHQEGPSVTDATPRDTQSHAVTGSHPRARDHQETDPDPEAETETETEAKTEKPTGSGDPVDKSPAPKPKKKAKGRSKPKTVIPDDFALTEKTLASCLALGIHQEQAEELVPPFVEYWQGEGTAKADWQAVFMSRIRRWLADGRIMPQKPSGPKRNPEEEARKASESLARSSQKQAARRPPGPNGPTQAPSAPPARPDEEAGRMGAGDPKTSQGAAESPEGEATPRPASEELQARLDRIWEAGKGKP
jgi:hypothetical protein